ncbi:ankyrin [Thozetella sp. PMI_491]|nr:ankyrin [Thozetella sp. PMI_491]
MAELVGVVSAGFGIASFALQVAGTIDAIRKIKSGKVIEDLAIVAERLEHLNVTLAYLSSTDRHPAVDRAAEFCQRRYARIDAALAKILKKLPGDSPHPGRRLKQLKLAWSYKEDEAIGLRDEINAIIMDLSLAVQISQLEAPRLQVTTNQASVFASQYSALSRYGIFKALEVGIDFWSESGGYTLRPALKVQPIVPYTSPGFEIIMRLKEGLLSFEEATTNLEELHRAEPTFKNHRNPAGMSYVHELVRYGPWINQEQQFSLIRLFVETFNVDLAAEDQSLLLDCVEWIGEGRHLELLDVILECGFDPDVANAQLFEQWPMSCYSNWRWESGTPDPFFLEYIATILNTCPGFAESTSLHWAILCGSVASMQRLLAGCPPLDCDVNLLGQSPLHLAVTDKTKFCLLLDAGYNMNAEDKWGTTPLMYAAALGHIDIVTLLITRGANLCLRDRKDDRTFLEYATARDNMELVVMALKAIEVTYGQDICQIFVRHALVQMISYGKASSCRHHWYGPLAQMCIDPNFTFGDHSDGTTDNNLMRYVLSLEEAKILVSLGYTAFNTPNSSGDLAIHSLAQTPRAVLIEYCLQNGANVNHRGRDGYTVIGSLILALHLASWHIWDVMDSIQICLALGADIFFGDDCRCPCSPDGCGATAIFQLDFKVESILTRAPEFVWALEWLFLVEEHRGPEAAKRVMLSYLHRIKCDENGVSISHVCCHRGHGKAGSFFGQRTEPKYLRDAVVDEILEEEEDFIEFLEQDMEFFATESLESLKRRWLSLLQESYLSHSKNMTSKSAESKSLDTESKLDSSKRYGYQFNVDRKKDEYIFGYFGHSAISFSRFPPVASSLATYALWLEHERTRQHTSEFYRLHKKGWYERRLASILALMDDLDITEVGIAKIMESENMAETRTEKIEPKAVSASFINSIQSLRATIAM